MAESVVSATLTKRRKVLERPTTRKKVQAMLVEGVADADIARQIGCSRQAVTAFKHRHMPELALAVAEVERGIEQYAIAHQIARVGEYQRLYDETDGKRKALPPRAGMVWATLLNAQRGILRDVAEERDQLPRGTVVNDNRVQVLIRAYEGFDPQEIQ